MKPRRRWRPDWWRRNSQSLLNLPGSFQRLSTHASALPSLRLRPRLVASVIAGLAVFVASFAAAPSTSAASSAGLSGTGPLGQLVTTGAAATTGQAVEITLITGDRVRYEAGPHGYQQVDVVDAVSTNFTGLETPGGLYLFPDVAEPYLASGVLDRELFNIEYLAINGYDDASMSRLPLIIDYAGDGPMVAARAASGAAGLAASRTGPVLESIGAAAESVDKTRADQFWASLAPQPTVAVPGPWLAGATGNSTAVEPRSLTAGELSNAVNKVWLDRKVTVALDESVPLIGAAQAWDAGLDGTGVTVAVLDTGFDATHPDLDGKVLASQSFVSDAVDDGHGHGTHVAATIAGSGAASDGQHLGVAPGADLIVGKVFDDTGNGTESQVIAGMEWAAQEQGADIISMSVGGSATDGTDPMSLAVNQLTAATDSLFVVSAGNSGPVTQSVTAPGTADAALTVAATDKSDGLAWFSSRGPRLDGALKPDIAAPGVHITAARAAGTSLCEIGCMPPHDGPVDEHYTSASGTSMAAPHVSGAAAILAQQHPDWDAAQLKTALMATSQNAGHTVYEQGAGRVDVARAVSQQLRTDTASISPGPLDAGDPATTVPITYTNDSTTDLTVSIAAEVRGPDGQPVTSGTVSLDRDTVTVPAGGIATVVATLDPNIGELGTYRGVIAASSASGDSLRTPVGFTTRPPLSELTVRLIKPAPVSDLRYFFQGFGWWVVRVDDQDLPWLEFDIPWRDTDDPQVLEATVAVPDGIYSVSGDPNWVGNQGRQMRNESQLFEPEVTVDGDTTITIDMGTLVPVTVNTDQPAEKVWRVYASARTSEAGEGLGSWSLNGMPEAYQEWRYPTEPVTVGDFWIREGFIFAEPDLLLDLRVAGEQLRLQPAYPSLPATSEDGYPKFTRDTDTMLATEADLNAGRDVGGALVHIDLPLAETDPDSWEQCPDSTERSMTCTMINRARLAGAAGAAGVLLTTPMMTLQALGALNLERHLAQLPVPVAWLDAIQAEQLASLVGAGETVEVRINAAVEPSYEYKAWFREAGQVPDDMSYELDRSDLKRIDVAYHRAEAAKPGLNNAAVTMHAYWPGEGAGFASYRYFDAPAQRSEYYLLTEPEVAHNLGHSWFEHSSELMKVGSNWRTISDTRFDTIDWATVATPGQVRLGEITSDDVALELCAVCRQGDSLWVRPSPTMSDGRPSWTFGYDSEPRLFGADGTEISELDAGQFVLPPEAGRYRLEHVQTDQAIGTRYGRQVHTVWDFTATARPDVNEVEPPYGKPRLLEPEPAAWQPVIFLNYEIPLALDKTAPDNWPIWIDVHAAAGAPGSGADIEGMELQASFDDGETWVEPRIVRPMGDGLFRILMPHPRLADTTGAVSLRAQVWDRAGNRVTQVVDRAYGLSDHRQQGRGN